MSNCVWKGLSMDWTLGFINSKKFSVWRMFIAGFFLTSVAQKTKTQAQNSGQKLKLREALSSLSEKLKKKLNFSQKFLKTEKNHGVPLWMPFFVNKYFKILPISHNFLKKIENWLKITFEKLKTQEKTQNSSKKLRVRQALASFLCPSGVEKSLT